MTRRVAVARSSRFPVSFDTMVRVLGMKRLLLAGLLAAGLGCAATTAPAPPPEERLVVLNKGDNSISLIPTNPDDAVQKIPFGDLGGAAEGVAARGETAVIAGGTSDQVVVVDLRAGNIRRAVPLAAGSNPVAVTMISDIIAYVANAGANTVTRLDITSGDTASVAVGVYPRDVILTRGRLFAVNGNVGACPEGLCPLGPSWLSVVDPLVNAPASGRDSIPLPQGNARSATLGGDGLVYVVSLGDTTAGVPGRLSIVDPIRREEVGTFGGFGLIPGNIASDGSERLFVTSVKDGLMEFNTRTRRVVRGAGQGIFVNDNIAVAVDSQGQIYAIEGGNCATGEHGRLRVFRADLTESRNLILGLCPVAATFVELPGLTDLTN